MQWSKELPVSPSFERSAYFLIRCCHDTLAERMPGESLSPMVNKQLSSEETHHQRRRAKTKSMPQQNERLEA